MFLEATLGLAFRQRAELVRVPAPTAVGRVLHFLSLGQSGEEWERETFAAADMIRALADALTDAGVTDVISAAADDEIIYRDDAGRDGDLDRVLESIAQRYDDQDDSKAIRLELVAQTRDELGSYLVQLTAERVHPIDRLPLRIQVYALLGAFDVRALQAEGYRGTPRRVTETLEQKLLDTVRSPAGLASVVAPLEARVVELCRTIEHSVRARLQTYPTEGVLLSCAIRPRRRMTYENSLPLGDEAHPLPVMRPYPGLREAAFYLYAWLGVLSQVGAKISRTLILDEGGRPVLHVGHEPADLGATKAFVPGESIAQPPGALDVCYFAGHDYEPELRAAARIAPGEGLVGDPAWRMIRERELGVIHDKREVRASLIDGRFLVIGQEGGPGSGFRDRGTH